MQSIDLARLELCVPLSALWPHFGNKFGAKVFEMVDSIGAVCSKGLRPWSWPSDNEASAAGACL